MRHLVRATAVGGLVLVVACASGVEDDSLDADAGSGGTTTSTSTSNGGAGGGSTTSGGLAFCGDGVAYEAEQCDGPDTRGATCISLGYLAGALGCDSSCQLDTSSCLDTLCGNEAIDGGEECDGDDLGGHDCSSAGYAGGTLYCDPACQFAGCYDGLVEGFEGGVIPTGWIGDWSVSSTSPHGGSRVAQNADIGDSATSSLRVAVTFDAAGTITFWHREDTEDGYDYLQFYVDNTLQGQWSGATSWTQSVVNVSAGSHTLEWRYDKDSSISDGADTVWIDDVTATGYLP